MQVAATQTAGLTRRETEVIAHKASGLNFELISNEMGCSTHTVKAHLDHAREKLHANDLASLINKAWLAGVLHKACLSFLAGLVLHAIIADDNVQRPVRYRSSRAAQRTTRSRKDTDFIDDFEIAITTDNGPSRLYSFSELKQLIQS